jgi:large-conductance mechanosensitive channel
MPVVNMATAATGGNWKDWYIPLTSAGAEGPKMLVGNVIGAIINFLVIGFICWRIAKVFVKPKVVTP